MSVAIDTTFGFTMQLRLICLLLIVVLSSSTASSGFIGSRSLLTVLAQHDQLHELVKDEKGGQNEGNMQNGDDYMYRTSNKNALFTPRGSKFPFKSTSAYFFRGGQAMNKNEVRCTMIPITQFFSIFCTNHAIECHNTDIIHIHTSFVNLWCRKRVH